MAKTRRSSIEIKDVATKQAVMFTVVDWDKDLRAAVAQTMRLAGVPDDNFLIDEIAPEPARGKD